MRLPFDAAWIIVLAVGCSKSSNSDHGKKRSDSLAGPESASPIVGGPLVGKIFGHDYVFERGLAYNDPSSGKVVVTLYASGGPLNCRIEGGDVQHTFADEAAASVEAAFVSIKIPSQSRAPLSSTSFEVHISAGDGANSPAPASSSLVEISEISDSRIVGRIRATSTNSSLAGEFTASYCQRASTSSSPAGDNLSKAAARTAAYPQDNAEPARCLLVTSNGPSRCMEYDLSSSAQAVKDGIKSLCGADDLKGFVYSDERCPADKRVGECVPDDEAAFRVRDFYYKPGYSIEAATKSCSRSSGTLIPQPVL